MRRESRGGQREIHQGEIAMERRRWKRFRKMVGKVAACTPTRDETRSSEKSGVRREFQFVRSLETRGAESMAPPMIGTRPMMAG